MTKITNNGRKLYLELLSSFGEHVSQEAQKTCSLLCRHAKTYQQLQELACNGYSDWRGDPYAAAFQLRCEEREKRLELLIAKLCAELPLVQGKPIRPLLGGDPRGCCVRLVLPDGRTNDFGREGICVLD